MSANAVIFGCAGSELTAQERAFFARTRPYGFILFARNCREPAQVRRLVADLRASVGRADAPVLIDQEGGRVARLAPPQWRAAPAPAAFGALARRDRAAAVEAVRANARLLALELSDLGITVDCLPLLDLAIPGAAAVIGDRAFGGEPELVAELGRACCEGLLAGGVLPVVKHIPGHGRARIDSHHALPRVATSRTELEATDFRPFRLLKDAPWAMTAHVVYEAIDPERPATTSARVIAEVIRGHVGFDGVLVSDDLSMKALSGGLAERTEAALEAGCDLALHCNGAPKEMAQVARAARPISAETERRLEAAARRPARQPDTVEPKALSAALDRLLEGV